MYTHVVQHSYPLQTQEECTDFPKKRHNSNPLTKPKIRSSFTFKLKAILKPQPAPCVPRAKRTGSGKKVTWDLAEEQVQPGESSVAEGEAWPSPDLEEGRLVDTVSMEPGSYVMSGGLNSDEDTTPTHVYHQRQDRMYERIIPIHSRSLNPLRSAMYYPRVSHEQSSSLPSEQTQDETQVSDHQRFSSFDVLDQKTGYNDHREAAWYKEANVDWTKNRVKSGTAKPVRFDLNSWSEKNRNYSIIEDLSHFLDEDTDKQTCFPIPEDQVSIIESEASSNHTFHEHDDIAENPSPFLHEHSLPLQHHQTRVSTLTNSLHTILPPVHTQPPRKYQENYIMLPLQTYGTSTVCEVIFSSHVNLLPSNYLTEITFETSKPPDTPTITKKESPTIYELSDRQCPPFYINTSTSLPHLNCITRSNPRMSYRQTSQEGNTLPRAKRAYRSPYQHLIPEDSIWTKQNSAQSSDPYLACDKSTGQMVSPSLKRMPFKRGHLEKTNQQMKSATSCSHLYANCSYVSSRPTGPLKCSYSASCVRDEYQRSAPYICYAAHDATPAYVTQESQSPYMNIDMFASNEEMHRYSNSECSDIGYRAPPRYFTPHPLGVCSECKEYIYPSPCQPVRIKNAIFHPDCFKCADCYSLLHVLSYQEAQGKFYCQRDFKRHVCCYVCKQPLASYRGRESPVNIYDKFFHPQCYRCTSCNTQTQKLSFDGRWLLCLRCTQTRSQQAIKQTQLNPRATLITLL